MKTYLLALATFTAVASVIAIAGVNTELFACGTSTCHKALEAADKARPAWAVCNINLECLRF